MTTQELVERLHDWIEDNATIDWPYPTLPHERIGALIVAAHRLSEMEAEIKRLRAIMQNVADSCPHQPLHPDEPEYDFGAHYFNTPDDYARYLSDKSLSDVGEVLRAALEHQP